MDIFKILTGENLERVKVYADTLNNRFFICYAKHGSSLTDGVWRVRKYDIISNFTNNVMSTDGYDNKATDLATVQSLIYY